ncbi:MAG TPA: hypothetical protein VGD65_25805 [Chryseosolibacter sp.]
MKEVIKRPIKTYIFHVLWIAFMLFLSTRSSSEPGKWILRSAAGIGLITFVHMIVRRNYFEVIGRKLIINEGILNRKTIEIEKIERFQIETGPLTASRIILKDKTEVKYSDSQANEKELKELMKHYAIPVE